MAQPTGNYTVVTILSGTQNSPEIRTPEHFDMMGIAAPAALPETVTVEIAERSEGTFNTLQSGGVDITIAAGKAIVLTQMPYSVFRLHAGVAVAADRTFRVVMKKRN